MSQIEPTPDNASERPMEVTLWGPPEPKNTVAARPGLRHVISGVLGAALFPLVPAIFFLIYEFQKPGADQQNTQEVLSALTSNGWFLLASMFLTWFGLLLPVYFAGKLTPGGWRELVKWKFRWAWDIPLALGIALGIHVLLTGVSLLLGALGIDTESLGNTSILTEAGTEWIIVLGLGAAIGAPLAEEIFFRGLTLNVAINGAKKALSRSANNESKQKQTRKLSIIFGVVSSSLLFGLLHLQDSAAGTLYTVSLTATLGAILAIITLRAKRLGTAVLTHAAFNSVSVIAVAVAAYTA